MGVGGALLGASVPANGLLSALGSSSLDMAAVLARVNPLAERVFYGLSVTEVLEDNLCSLAELREVLHNLHGYSRSNACASMAEQFTTFQGTLQDTLSDNAPWHFSVTGFFNSFRQLGLSVEEKEGLVELLLSDQRSVEMLMYYFPELKHLSGNEQRDEIKRQMLRMISDPEYCSTLAADMRKQITDAYKAALDHLKEFPDDLERGRRNYAREKAEEAAEQEAEEQDSVNLPVYKDMAAARKAGGYPVPNGYTRPEARVGNHYTSSGERYEYCGKVAPPSDLAR